MDSTAPAADECRGSDVGLPGWLSADVIYLDIQNLSIRDGIGQVYMYGVFLKIGRGDVDLKGAHGRVCDCVTSSLLRQVSHQLPKHRGKGISKLVAWTQDSETDEARFIKLLFMSLVIQNGIRA